MMIRKLEWCAGGAATALLVCLHAVFFLDAGVLWRDEVNSVNLATLPSLREVWANLQYDSFPALFMGVLRAWVRLGAGTSDEGLRAFGGLVGVGILGMLWWNARRLGYAVPLFGVALFGFNSAVIVYGDSVRGYGLGMLTGLVAFGLIWHVVDEPSPRRLVLALLAAVSSVHCLFYNAVFLLAACAGGVAVAWRRHLWKRAFLPVGIGIAAAVSLLPYVETIRSAGAWNIIVQYPVDLGWIASKFREALEPTGRLMPWVWIAATALAVGAAIRSQVRREAGSRRQQDVALFCAVALVTGAIGYVVFLEVLSYPTQPWYYLTLMALAGTCLDGALEPLARTPRGRIARLLGVGAIVALVLPPVLLSARTRMTNVDLVARKVREGAAAGDLVVVNPWYYGVSFARYYEGAADWVTLPPISFHRLHRYDLLKEQMMSPDPLRPVLERVQRTLQAGGRVWWVGSLGASPEGQAPPSLPPAPHGPWGWSDGPYYQVWTLQAGHYLRANVVEAHPVPIGLEQRVSKYEDLPLYLLEGWRAAER